MALVWQSSFFGVMPTTCTDISDCNPSSQFIDGEITARGTGPLSFGTNPFYSKWDIPNTIISIEWHLNYSTLGSENTWEFKIYLNNEVFKGITGGNAQNISSGNFCYGLDIANEKAFVNPSMFWEGTGWRQASMGWSDAEMQIFYNAINNIITYTWQSVPSISGKNGISTLSTLNDVNDGEPVETSDTSKFNLTDGSNVSALVTAHFSQ